MLDTAAVAELLWEGFLPAPLRDELDAACEGRGKQFFMWLAGVHDIGKATPAFQALDPELAAGVRAAGLSFPRVGLDYRKCPHNLAGDQILRALLKSWRWPVRQSAWIGPMVSGHHGRITTVPRDMPTGDRAWQEAQAGLVGRVCAELGVDLVPPVAVPSPPAQLALSGAVVMADWLASNDQVFPPIRDLAEVSLANSRARAAQALRVLQISGGPQLGAGGDGRKQIGYSFVDAFGFAARPVQELAVAVAAAGPGLMIIEAPTGEGKTEAGLAVAEVFGAARGCDGLFMAMPTQATSDPMFARVLSWADRYPGVGVGLLHGKRQLNPQWAALLDQVAIKGVDEYGLDADPYGMPDGVAQADEHPGSHTPAEWFLGRQRGLLMPFVVGTVDQLLLAAAAIRFVSLRHLGLFGKVVVVDEVHAYDAYMSEFLKEALRWLGGAGVPVVLMSATLPEQARHELLTSYGEGLTQLRADRWQWLGDDQTPAQGYPRISVLRRDQPAAGPLAVEVVTCAPSGPDREVAVAVLPEDDSDPWGPVAQELNGLLVDGGVALVVCNTVGRAQACYQRLKGGFGADVVLLHGRLLAGERAERAQRLLDELGPPPDPAVAGRPNRVRPHRRIVVATQVAEQSFDIDADVLVSDLAPVDLLIQRLGRVHRHDRPAGSRPAALVRPRMLITGYTQVGGVPAFPAGSEYVYQRLPLLAAALAVSEQPVWVLPSGVPQLVSAAYWPSLWPESWRDDAAAAQIAWDDLLARRKSQADQFLLRGRNQLGTADLRGLHDRDAAVSDEETARAIVRDGEESVEVTLLDRDSEGEVRTLSGRCLGPDGDAVRSDPELLSEVIGSSVRLPADKALTRAVLDAGLSPLPGWLRHPWLGHSRVLFLGDQPSSLNGFQISYDPELGLLTTRKGPLGRGPK